MLIFIDDILVYSRNIEEHKKHLHIVLKTLREHQLYEKYNKCEFFKQHIQYLGHVITKYGITVDWEKIKAIMEWPIPKNVVDIRSFMGLDHYYRWFIKGFSKVAYSIICLQKKGRTFKWIVECQNSLDQLKHLLTTNFLRIVDPSKEFTLWIDACKEGVGGLLMQEAKVVAYESWKLKEHEHKYLEYDLELTTVIHVLKMWRHYFLGKIFTLMIDHNSLTNNFRQPTINARQALGWIFKSVRIWD